MKSPLLDIYAQNILTSEAYVPGQLPSYQDSKSTLIVSVDESISLAYKSETTPFSLTLSPLADKASDLMEFDNHISDLDGWHWIGTQQQKDTVCRKEIYGYIDYALAVFGKGATPLLTTPLDRATEEFGMDSALFSLLYGAFQIRDYLDELQTQKNHTSIYNALHVGLEHFKQSGLITQDPYDIVSQVQAHKPSFGILKYALAPFEVWLDQVICEANLPDLESSSIDALLVSHIQATYIMRGKKVEPWGKYVSSLPKPLREIIETI